MTATMTASKSVVTRIVNNLIRNALLRADRMVDSKARQVGRNKMRNKMKYRLETGATNTRGFRREMFARSKFLMDMANLPKSDTQSAVIKRARKDLHVAKMKGDRDLIHTALLALESAAINPQTMEGPSIEEVEAMFNEEMWAEPIFECYR